MKHGATLCLRNWDAKVILILSCAMWGCRTNLARPHTTWREYLGNADSSHYSAVAQINRSNVKELRVAWTFPTGDNGTYCFNPIVVDGVMYVLAQNASIVALNAATGKDLWAHKITPPGMRYNPRVTWNYRGISYWQSKNGSDRRILFVSNNYLQEINARTGKLITSFGKNGLVDLRDGLGRDPKSIYQIESGTPGRVFDNLIIEGSAPGENVGAPPGDIRAYNVLTGRMAWIFHTIPHPGEVGYNTWPKGAWKTAGGADCWGEITVDDKHGIVYIPTAAAKDEFWGADRIGKDLFADCLLALNARTGKLLWYFQDVHHSIFDYDLAAAPQLLTVRHHGKKVDIVGVAGKDGFLYVFNRLTGKPLWPIVERPVPKSHIPGEEAWPTQPFPTAPPPFGRQKFTAADINPYLPPQEGTKLRKMLLGAINNGLFTPPETRDTVEMPGNNGGANWGYTAADPAKGMMFVLSKAQPSILKMRRTPPTFHFKLPGTLPQQGRILYMMNCEMCHQMNLQGQPPTIPALTGVTKILSADMIGTMIQHGMGEMPAFKNLDSSQVKALIAFLTDPNAGVPPPGSRASFFRPPRLKIKPVNGKIPVRYWTGYGYLESKTVLSAISPPWSTLTAYDLNTGKIKWQVPFGNVPEYAAKGITGTGTITPRDGVVVTGGGLIFAATRSEGKLRAYDEDTGKVLWETQLPAGSEGVPAVYEVHGREYLMVSATLPEGTWHSVALQAEAPGLHRVYIAFALSKGS